MATMKIEVVNPYENELEKPLTLENGGYLHTHHYAETLRIQHEGQHFYLFWDEERNALKILDTSNNGNLCVFPSSNNGILIQSVKQ
jgi:hypothetical protein